MSKFDFTPQPIKKSVLVVDDEVIARQRLRQLLQPYQTQLEVIGEASDGQQAQQQIEQLRPDVVFLDIEMPGKNGLQVVKELQYQPLIVFVTAYEQYAVKAFEENSLDYLLKPVEPIRLARTVQRLLERQQPSPVLPAQLQALLEQLQPVKELKVIPVKTGDQIVLVPVKEIVFLEAKDKYVTLHLVKKKYLLDQSLAYLEERLPADFIRVQRAYIINQNHIQEIRKYFNGGFVFTMATATTTSIKSGSTYQEELKRRFEI
ncbi:LytR/AlgR family response regulator transcription factor [Adhaeribacter radiodurans]|uniref:Response regulator transcription factor n=1 Tax=Adhaeribacter radiodurans TaxID=2745197 RepID=A0A7L7L7T0_9BACT|nr:LytTR family DNA-binding domain-containing protein [Adhaeribacter radiodurans]QMU28804.1 response regulator transcription factor [Adhaeribacter radiodurans]